MADRSKKTKISTESYKGVRDFYPENQFIQNYIFNTWRKTAEKFGYKEYNASILEPAELYRAKTGEEIVNEQTYTFTDRGGREVTLRPEMTPTIARMVAGKRRELVFPLRWFSMPNLFRYERPQRGRLREHWQLNADIFGVDNTEAEIEIISLAVAIMDNFGIKREDYVVKINDRKLVEKTLSDAGLGAEKSQQMQKLIDRKAKIQDFEEQAWKLAGEKFNYAPEPSRDVTKVIARLKESGIENLEFDPYIMRGFDYYTGIVFEIFDKTPENNRSLFGGGRYDRLLEIFGDKKMPAMGFGMGDVTIRDALESYGLLPTYQASAALYLCNLGPQFIQAAQELAHKLRKENLSVEVDLTDDKVGNQIKRANKTGARFVICLGENEVGTGKYRLKELSSGKETETTETEIPNFIRTNLPACAVRQHADR